MQLKTGLQEKTIKEKEYRFFNVKSLV